jgi:hypothetical protein
VETSKCLHAGQTHKKKTIKFDNSHSKCLNILLGIPKVIYNIKSYFSMYVPSIGNLHDNVPEQVCC